MYIEHKNYILSFFVYQEIVMDREDAKRTTLQRWNNDTTLPALNSIWCRRLRNDRYRLYHIMISEDGKTLQGVGIDHNIPIWNDDIKNAYNIENLKTFYRYYKLYITDEV